MTAPCELLEWDSAFWGLRVARVLGNRLTAARWRQADDWCRQQRIACLYFLADADDVASPYVAEAGGFHLADIRMTYSASVAAFPVAADTEQRCSARIRESRPADLPSLELLAAASHQNTRFSYDARFPRDRSRALYSTWIKRSCEGYADIVWVAELAGAPVGYLSCHLRREVDAGIIAGTIGLVAVGERARGHGVGPKLVRHGLTWFKAQGATDVTVVTQGRNQAAQRLYQRCGFLLDSVQLWYHKWYEPVNQAVVAALLTADDAR